MTLLFEHKAKFLSFLPLRQIHSSFPVATVFRFLPGVPNLKEVLRQTIHANRASKAKPAAVVVHALLISSDAAYRSFWHDVFIHRGWQLDWASSLSEALTKLHADPVPVVVYDSRQLEEDCCEVLTCFQKLTYFPCVLLTSSVIDESLRDEVVRLHGYDVLPRHAGEDEIARTIDAAWFWKQHHA